jgi:hypothetical protein
MPWWFLVRLPASAARQGADGAADQLEKAGVRGVRDIPATGVRPLTGPYDGRRWTTVRAACHSLDMAAADPLLVTRRHVDLLRVRSAICL